MEVNIFTSLKHEILSVITAHPEVVGAESPLAGVQRWAAGRSSRQFGRDTNGFSDHILHNFKSSSHVTTSRVEKRD